jgi:hypothetical protein
MGVTVKRPEVSFGHLIVLSSSIVVSSISSEILSQYRRGDSKRSQSSQRLERFEHFERFEQGEAIYGFTPHMSAYEKPPFTCT